MGFADAETVKDPVSIVPVYIGELSKKSGDLLLFLDNIDGINSDPTANLLKMILTQVPGIRIITTCRTRLELGPIADNHLVAPLDSKDAAALFMGLLPDDDYIHEQFLLIAKSNNILLERFLTTLGGHPLSIFLAAHRIAAGHDPMEKQLADAYTNTLVLLNAPEIKGLPERQKSLKISLDQSFEQLFENAKNIFCKAGFFPGGLYRHVSTLDKLLGEGWRGAMEEILAIGLCRFQKNEQHYWLLNPVREYSEDRLSETGNTEFYREVSKHWAEFVSLYNYLLNPAQNPGKMKELDLPEEPDAIRQRLAELHDIAFSALRAEEQNILHAFRWAIENAFQAGEAIAEGIGDYLTLSDKRRTRAWIAQATMEQCEEISIKAKWIGTLGNILSELGEREGARERAEEAVEIYRELVKLHPGDSEIKRKLDEYLGALEQLEKTENGD